MMRHGGRPRRRASGTDRGPWTQRAVTPDSPAPGSNCCDRPASGGRTSRVRRRVARKSRPIIVRARDGRPRAVAGRHGVSIDPSLPHARRVGPCTRGKLSATRRRPAAGPGRPAARVHQATSRSHDRGRHCRRPPQYCIDATAMKSALEAHTHVDAHAAKDVSFELTAKIRPKKKR